MCPNEENMEKFWVESTCKETGIVDSLNVKKGTAY